MSDLYVVKDLVATILDEMPQTRDDDDLLYLEVIKRSGMDTGCSIHHFFINRKNHNIPAFESVRRSRQKVQAEYPELKGNRVEDRKEAEQAYYDFARR